MAKINNDNARWLCPACLVKGRVAPVEIWVDGYSLCRECRFNSYSWEDLAGQQNALFSEAMRKVAGEND